MAVTEVKQPSRPSLHSAAWPAEFRTAPAIHCPSRLASRITPEVPQAGDTVKREQQSLINTAPQCVIVIIAMPLSLVVGSSSALTRAHYTTARRSQCLPSSQGVRVHSSNGTVLICKH